MFRVTSALTFQRAARRAGSARAAGLVIGRLPPYVVLRTCPAARGGALPLLAGRRQWVHVDPAEAAFGLREIDIRDIPALGSSSIARLVDNDAGGFSPHKGASQ